MGADCKSVGFAFEGSNPSPATEHQTASDLRKRDSLGSSAVAQRQRTGNRRHSGHSQTSKALTCGNATWPKGGGWASPESVSYSCRGLDPRWAVGGGPDDAGKTTSDGPMHRSTRGQLRRPGWAASRKDRTAIRPLDADGVRPDQPEIWTHTRRAVRVSRPVDPDVGCRGFGRRLVNSEPMARNQRASCALKASPLRPTLEP